MTQKILTVLLAAFALVATFTATAFAAGAAAPADGSWLDLAKPVIDAVMAGQWFMGGSLLLVLAVGLASKYGSKRWPFLATGAGKALLLLVGSFGAALAASGVAVPTVAVLLAALKVAFATAGGFTVLRALLSPLAAKAPAWLRPIIDLVLWFFDRKPTPAAVAKAEAAGDAAVAAKPSTGVAGFIGKPRDIQ